MASCTAARGLMGSSFHVGMSGPGRGRVWGRMSTHFLGYEAAKTRRSNTGVHRLKGRDFWWRVVFELFKLREFSHKMSICKTNVKEVPMRLHLWS